VCNDEEDFVDTFGQILTMRNETQELAASILYQLSQRFSLNLIPSKVHNDNGFLGIHLRTSTDAVGVRPQGSLGTGTC
jgi:hypothetical protein